MKLENRTGDVRLTVEGVYENHPVMHNNNFLNLGRFDTSVFYPLLRWLNDIGIKSTDVSYADSHSSNYINNGVSIKANRSNLRFTFNHGGLLDISCAAQPDTTYVIIVRTQSLTSNDELTRTCFHTNQQGTTAAIAYIAEQYNKKAP